eukprot:9475565-Pyramimonas_sp.AAC.1
MRRGATLRRRERKQRCDSGGGAEKLNQTMPRGPNKSRESKRINESLFSTDWKLCTIWGSSASSSALSSQSFTNCDMWNMASAIIPKVKSTSSDKKANNARQAAPSSLVAPRNPIPRARGLALATANECRGILVCAWSFFISHQPSGRRWSTRADPLPPLPLPRGD